MALRLLIQALNQLINRADDLLDVVRGRLATAVTNGQLSTECAAEITGFLDRVQVCVANVPRVP